VFGIVPPEFSPVVLAGLACLVGALQSVQGVRGERAFEFIHRFPIHFDSSEKRFDEPISLRAGHGFALWHVG